MLSVPLDGCFNTWMRRQTSTATLYRFLVIKPLLLYWVERKFSRVGWILLFQKILPTPPPKKKNFWLPSSFKTSHPLKICNGLIWCRYVYFLELCTGSKMRKCWFYNNFNSLVIGLGCGIFTDFQVYWAVVTEVIVYI